MEFTKLIFLKPPDGPDHLKFMLPVHAYLYALSAAILEGNFWQKIGQIWRSGQS